MLGMIIYTVIVAVPTYLAAWLVDPIAGAAFVALAVAGSTWRYLKHRGDRQEEGGYWGVALPAYVFCVAMLIAWF